MALSQKFKADAAIHQRREAEYHLRKLTDEIRGDRNLHHKANWEAKTENIIKKNLVRNRLDDMKKRQESDLNERRAKLAALLELEDQVYEKEFMENLETPEQVRQKMAVRLEELKKQREEERSDEVHKRLEKRFRAANDDLRLDETRFQNYGCQIEREKQLIDKRRQIEQNIMEEQVFAQLWKLDEQKKIERERQELEEKKKAGQATLNILNWQTEERKKKTDQDQQFTEQERQMLNKQWQIESKMEQDLEHQKFILNRERNIELIQHNEQERILKVQQTELEKQRDKYMLDNALKREQALKDLEEAERLNRRHEVLKLQKYYQTLKSDQKAYEDQIAYLVQQEAEKQQKMRDDTWAKEDQARINLLKNVYQSREQDIELRKQLKANDQFMLAQEKREIEEKIKLENQQQEDKERQQALKRKNHQNDILMQIGERDRALRREVQEKMFEERAAKLAELEYQRRINSEKNQNTQVLDQWKQTVSNH